MAAPRSGPALSLQEKALRLLLALLRRSLLLSSELERFDLRFWVRVAINSSLAGFAVSTVGAVAPFRSRSPLREPFGAMARRRLRVPWIRSGRRAPGSRFVAREVVVQEQSWAPRKPAAVAGSPCPEGRAWGFHIL